MTSSRRDFVQLAASVAGVAGTFAWGSVDRAALAAAVEPQADTTWNLAWVDKVKGRHKAVFDCIEPESGVGVWRAGVWGQQYRDVLKAAASDMSPVIVLRHDAIPLIMTHAFWQKYGVGAKAKIEHPMTGAPVDRNPALFGEADGVPAPFANYALDKQIAAGTVVLACNLAFKDVVGFVKDADKVDETEARARAIAGIIPGVILQPSGVFAVIRAQEAGCVYIKAS
jgi:hypothetical protein